MSAAGTAFGTALADPLAAWLAAERAVTAAPAAPSPRRKAAAAAANAAYVALRDATRKGWRPRASPQPAWEAWAAELARNDALRRRGTREEFRESCGALRGLRAAMAREGAGERCGP